MRRWEGKAFAQSRVVNDEQSQNFKLGPINSQSPMSMLLEHLEK